MDADVARTIIRVPHTDACVYDITLVKEGKVLEGSLVLWCGRRVRQPFGWSARRLEDGSWEISGEGAIIVGGDRVANAENYPFSMDPQVNEGVKDILSAWLAERFPAHVPEKALKTVWSSSNG